MVPALSFLNSDSARKIDFIAHFGASNNLDVEIASGREATASGPVVLASGEVWAPPVEGGREGCVRYPRSQCIIPRAFFFCCELTLRCGSKPFAMTSRLELLWQRCILH
jgi:hypothetical protein